MEGAHKTIKEAFEVLAMSQVTRWTWGSRQQWKDPACGCTKQSHVLWPQPQKNLLQILGWKCSPGDDWSSTGKKSCKCRRCPWDCEAIDRGTHRCPSMEQLVREVSLPARRSGRHACSIHPIPDKNCRTTERAKKCLQTVPNRENFKASLSCCCFSLYFLYLQALLFVYYKIFCL